MARRLLAYFVGLLILEIIIMSPATVRAQSIFGTITGTVADPSGAAVPGANLTLTNTSSGDLRKTVTNSDGYYSFSSVPAGSYTLKVEAKGFRTAVTQEISVQGASSQSFPFKLSIAEASTTVEVTGSAAQIIPTSSGQKTVVLTQKQLQDFTIVGADAAEFIKILPGFAQRNNGDGLKTGTDFNGTVIGINGNGDGGSQSPLNGAFVANGTGVNNMDITADGAHVSDPGCNCATPVNPNTDMIQEFQVLTSNYGAENAKGPVVINTIAKQGGHDFHGLASMDIRDWKLNSNSWINNYTGTAKPQNKFLYPQFQIGGPVLIPGTDFNKNRDKLFFFSAFEYYFQTLDTGLLGATVPTANMRNGDFSPAELSALGTTANGSGPSQILSSLTCSTCAYPGGIIPNSAINPAGQGFTNLFPLPNADPNSNGGYNYVKDVVFDQNSWQSMSRVDYNISDYTKLYVRYNLQKETQQFPIGLWWRNGVQVPYPTPVLGKNVSDSVSASLTHVFSPTMSNEFVFGYTYINFPNVFQDPNKVSKSALGISFGGISNGAIDQIPSFTGWGGEFATLLNPSGFQLGGDQGLFAKKHLPSFSDTLSKVWGTHTAKFGAYYEFVINNQPSNNYANGLFQQANWASNTGNPWADLLTGYVGSYSQTNKDVLHNEGYKTFEFFAQDSWKATRRLTLSYGLRVSHMGAWYDRQDNGFAIFDPSLYDPAASANSGTGFTWHARDANIPTSGFPNRQFYPAPRLGAAYDLFGNGRTVLRGGWGQFYFHNAQFTQGLDTPLGVQTPGLCCAVSFATIEATQFGQAPFSAAGVDGKDDNTPRTTSYSFTVDQRMPFSSMLELSYVGNKSRYLLNQSGVGTNINVIPYGTLFNIGKSPNVGSGEYLYGPYPQYQSIPIANHNLYSNYNALQVSWVRQKGRYDLALNYTYEKSLGIVGLNQLDLSQDYGAMPFDRRQLFNAAYSINLPSPVHDNKFGQAFVNGWQFSGITQLQSGVNLTANSNGANPGFDTSGNISGLFAQGYPSGYGNVPINAQSINGTDQIPLMPIFTCDPRANLGPHQYLNGNCFSVPTNPGQNGPIVLPEYFGPWYFNSDLGLFKNFQFTESKKLQVRFSAYNFMNHPIWSFAGSGVGSSSLQLGFGPNGSGGQKETNSNFGIAPIKQGNRIIQISAKFFF